jgi:heme/copper-type cytochrome/quinol oxidase subunit 2
MLFSSLLTGKAVEYYNKNHKKESYDATCGGSPSLLLLIVAVIFLIIEICMLYFAIKVALASGKSPETTFVHVILALTLTLPYLLLSLTFNPAARAALGDGAPALQFACNY